MKLQPDGGSRSSLGIELGSNNVVGHHCEFARRFAKGIGKLTGRSLEEDRKTRRKISGRFGLHLKKIGSGRRCALRRRIREWT
ncbi:hypothetical protein BHE74_00043115 [Ensete ventricosum]|nr:hypothetical protein BHE74_00043115 [Ensete ventricosum]